MPKQYIAGITYQGSIDLFGGNSGVGKSPLRARQARSLLSGEDFLGLATTAIPAGSRIVWLTQGSKYSFRPLLERSGIAPEMAEGRLK